MDNCDLDLDLGLLQARFNAIMGQVNEVERTHGVAAADLEFGHLMAEEPSVADAIHSNDLVWLLFLSGFELAQSRQQVAALEQQLRQYELRHARYTPHEGQP